MAWKINWLSKKDDDGFIPEASMASDIQGMSSDNAVLSSIPAAYAAINGIASSLAGLPKVVAELQDPINDYYIDTERATTLTALFRRPSSIYSPNTFWNHVFRPIYSDGNSYCYILRNGSGRPIELIACNLARPARWNTENTGRIFDIRLTNGPSSNQMTVGEKDLLTFHGPGFDGLKSPSPIQYAGGDALRSAKKAHHYQQVLFEGVNLRQAIKADSSVRMTPKDYHEFREHLLKGYNASRAAGTVPVLPRGWDLVGGSMSVADIQLIEILKYTVEDIARVFNYPLRMLQHFHDGMRTSTMFESQASDYERWTIKPEARSIQDQMTYKLLMPDEILANLVIRIPTESIGLGSWSERLKAAADWTYGGGLGTVNEARKMLGYPAIEGGDKLVSPKGAPAQAGAVDNNEQDAIVTNGKKKIDLSKRTIDRV